MGRRCLLESTYRGDNLMQPSALWYFERFGLLQGLTEAQKQHVEQNTRMLQVKRGEAVFLPGDPTEHLYIVKTGAVKIVGSAPEGGDVIISLLKPGDIFGEMALEEGAAQDHRAEAADDTLLCEVPRTLVVRMIEEAPAFGLHVTKLIGRRLRTLRSRVGELLGKSAPARLAHALLDLAREHGVQDGEGVLIPIRLSQSELGKLVGLTRETVNGILNVWRDQGILQLDRRRIRLMDAERLKRVR